MFLVDKLSRAQYSLAVFVMRKIAVQEYDNARRLGYSAAEASDSAIAVMLDYKGMVECLR